MDSWKWTGFDLSTPTEPSVEAANVSFRAHHRVTTEIVHSRLSFPKEAEFPDRWAEYGQGLDLAKWNPRSRIHKTFNATYGVFPEVVATLQAFMPPKTKKSCYSSGSELLMALKELRGSRRTDIAEFFGGDVSTVSKAQTRVFRDLTAFNYVVQNHFPKSKTEIDAIKEALLEADRPFPDIVFVGDCTDLPIWTSASDYYTHKRNCPSSHAIRSAVICRRDTMLPVWIKTGVAPSGRLGSDAKILLSSEIDNVMRRANAKTMWDGGIPKGDIPWIESGVDDATFKKERGRIERYFGAVKAKFGYFQQAHKTTKQDDFHAYDNKFHTAAVLYTLNEMAARDVKNRQGVKWTEDVTSLF